MNKNKYIEANSNIYQIFFELIQRAIKITMGINAEYHTPNEIVKLFSKLKNKKVGITFRLFPPFYTDCNEFGRKN